MSKKTIIASAIGLAMAGGLAFAQTGTTHRSPALVHRRALPRNRISRA